MTMQDLSDKEFSSWRIALMGARDLETLDSLRLQIWARFWEAAGMPCTVDGGPGQELARLASLDKLWNFRALGNLLETDQERIQNVLDQQAYDRAWAARMEATHEIAVD